VIGPEPVAWHWRNHPAPPSPRAAVAWGGAARDLLSQLERLTPAHQGRLSVHANRDVVVVQGATEDLPWVEGVSYAAPAEDAPSLWLPTREQPDAALDLLARALVQRHHRQPLLLWATPQALIPLDRPRSASPAVLARIRARWAEA
jgi:hypothetical protein